MISSFVKALGNSPRIRVWDYLVVTRGMFDFSMTDLSEGSDVSWNTLKGISPDFIKKRIIVPTRNIGRATLYKLNEEHPESRFMITLHKAISMVFVRGGELNIKTQITKIKGNNRSGQEEIDIPVSEGIGWAKERVCE